MKLVVNNSIIEEDVIEVVKGLFNDSKVELKIHNEEVIKAYSISITMKYDKGFLVDILDCYGSKLFLLKITTNDDIVCCTGSLISEKYKPAVEFVKSYKSTNPMGSLYKAVSEILGKLLVYLMEKYDAKLYINNVKIEGLINKNHDILTDESINVIVGVFKHRLISCDTSLKKIKGNKEVNKIAEGIKFHLVINDWGNEEDNNLQIPYSSYLGTEAVKAIMITFCLQRYVSGCMYNSVM